MTLAFLIGDKILSQSTQLFRDISPVTMIAGLTGASWNKQVKTGKEGPILVVKIHSVKWKDINCRSTAATVKVENKLQIGRTPAPTGTGWSKIRGTKGWM